MSQDNKVKIKAVLFDLDGVLVDAREWHYDALNQALDSTYNRLAKVNNIINKLEHIAYHSKYNEDDTTCDIEDCPDPGDDAVDVTDIL